MNSDPFHFFRVNVLPLLLKQHIFFCQILCDGVCRNRYVLILFLMQAHLSKPLNFCGILSESSMTAAYLTFYHETSILTWKGAACLQLDRIVTGLSLHTCLLAHSLFCNSYFVLLLIFLTWSESPMPMIGEHPSPPCSRWPQSWYDQWCLHKTQDKLFGNLTAYVKFLFIWMAVPQK